MVSRRGRAGQVLVGVIVALLSISCLTSFSLVTNAQNPGAPGVPQALAATPSDGSVTLTWQAPASPGDSAITGYNISRSSVSGTIDTLASLGDVRTYIDDGVSNGITYYYRVCAVNEQGQGEWTDEVPATPTAPITPPGPPTLDPATPGDGQVTLRWAAPNDDGGSAVINYRVYRGETSGGEAFLIELDAVLTFTDTSVINGETYYYKVSAKNEVGEGPLSNERSATPAATISPPGAPTLTTATPGNGQVTLAWTAPSNDGGGDISSYKMYRGTSSGGESLIATLGNVLTYTDTGLTNGQTYFYTVRAVNSAGEGPTSNELSALPSAPLTVPGAPSLTSATAGNAQVRLDWTVPANDGGSAITGYRIYRGTSSGGEVLLTTLGSVLTYTDTGLTNGQAYYYKVGAVNGAGEGPLSNERSATPLTVPGAPSLTSASAGNGQVTLAWSAPTSNGGGAITMYSIYRGTTSSGESFLVSAGNVLTYSDTSVINGQTYFYRVTAVNGAGEGALSNERSATPEAPTTAPGPPSNVRATASDGRIALSWSVPTDDGGQAITGYMVYRGTSRTSLAPLGSISGTAYSDATIVNGVTYYYQVSALNPAEGDRSAVVSAVFIIPPSPPTDLMATGGNGFITLSWSSPARDGGSGVTSYNVYRGVNATSLALYRSTGDRSFTDMDVVGGVEYAYMVRAVNGAGESDASSTAFASALQVLSTPSVPQNVTAVPLRGNVSLSWGLPASDGGSPVTGYRIYRAEDPVALVPIANTTGLWYNDTTTVRGMTYHYAITALNSLGEGARSGEVNITVPLASVPSQPRDLVIWVDEGTVILSWDMPTLSGGSTIEGFIVYRGTSPEDLSVISMVNGSTFRDVRCNAGVTYYYAILAVNEAGWGPSTPIAIAYLPRSSEISSPLDLMVISGLTIGGVGGIYYLLRRGKRPQD